MYEKFYRGKMGGDLYRMQQRERPSDARPLMPQHVSGLPVPEPVAEPAPIEPPPPQKEGIARLIPQSISSLAQSDDVLILGILILLLSEKSDLDITLLLTLLLLK